MQVLSQTEHDWGGGGVSSICEHDYLRRKCPFCEIAQLERENEQFRAELDRLKRVGWISVKERLPEEEGEYLVFYKYKKNENRVDIALFSRFGWHKAYEITHWMPLPEPPKGEDNE